MFWHIALLFFFLQVTLPSEAVNGTVTGCDGHPCSPGEKEVQPITSDREEAILLSRCQAKCLETFAGALVASARQSHTLWPAVSLASIKETTCLNITDLEDCRRGCFIRSKNSSSTRIQCRRQCKAECNEHVKQKCGGTMPCYGAMGFQDCSFNCRDPGCRSGCNKPLPPSTNPLPASPLSPINLTKKLQPLPQGPGIFDVGPYEVPRDNTSNTTEHPPTTFLIQVDTTSGSYFYLKDTIISGTLDLGHFACQATNISFSAVTASGASNFSPLSPVCIHGGTRYPIIQPNSLSYTVSLDARKGFEDYVVVNISWKKPLEYHLATQYILHFEVYDSGSPCDSSPLPIINSNINGTRTHTIAAPRPNPALPHLPSLPKINCKYLCTFEVLPQETSNNTQIVINTHSATFYPQIEHNCTYEVNEKTGTVLIQAKWYIENTRDTQILVNATSKYEVNKQIINWSGDIRNVPSVAYQFPRTEIASINNILKVYSYEAEDIEPITDQMTWIRIYITPERKSNTTFRHLPQQVLCLLQPRPLAPSTINPSSILVEMFELTSTSSGVIRLVLTWKPPPRPYGKIENYQIRILRQSKKSNDVVKSAIQVATTFKEQNVSSGQLIVEQNIYIDEDAVCLYAQIRAKNPYFWGPWSDSIPLLRYPANPNCTPLTTSTIQQPTNAPFIGLPQEVKVGLGAGIGSIAALLLCVILLSVLICTMKRHRMKVQMKRVFENGYATPMFLVRGSRDTNSLRLPLSLTYPTPEMDEWEIPVGAVIVESKFGEGCFGEVHRGVVRGPIQSTRSMKTNICVAVAIKMLKNTATGSERTDFIHEIETMKKVAQGNNPHVITFIGCVTLQEPLCLITEFVKYGDLLSYLETIRKLVTHKNRQKRMAKLMADLSKEPEPYLEPHSQDQYEEFPLSGAAAVQSKPEFGKDVTGDKVVPLPGTLYAELGGVEPVNLLSFAYQIAYGMEYLANIDVVHRDLACRNILIGEHKTLKISDFGMSRIVTGEDIYVKTTKGRLPWKWMSIESIVNREFTHASDVWAYGITIWEIATLGGFPYPTISNADLLDHLKKGYRLECPENCSPEVYNVMTECWSEYPEDRRTFTELRSLFDAMLAEDSPYIQFENINIHKPYYNIGSRRNTKCEGEDIIANLSGSEMGFESSTSTMTLNGASVNGGAYDNLIPLLTRDTPPSDLEEQQSYNLHIANQYVDTPTTFKSLEQDEGNAQTTEVTTTDQYGP